MTVSGGGLSRVFQVDGGVTASISGLTITGGKTAVQRRRPVQRQRHGHADQLHRQRQLRHRTAAVACTTSGGTATLTNCTVSGNSAADVGGGLFNICRHGHAHQLHRQRQLRRSNGGGV